MGYFSDAAISAEYRDDRSCPAPMQQLEWRLEDLQNRLEEICQVDCEDRSRYAGEDLACALPEDLHDREAILAAIAVATAKLEQHPDAAGEQTEKPATHSAPPAAPLTKAA